MRESGWQVRNALFIILAVHKESMLYRMMEAVLQSVCRGLDDPVPMVRNAALFALGQFSEHLQVRHYLTAKLLFSLSFSVKCLTSFAFCCLDIVILKILFSTKLCQMLLKILKVAECSQHKQEKDFFHSLCYGSLFPTTSKISPSKFDSVVLFHVAAQYQQVCPAVAATAVSVFRKSY